MHQIRVRHNESLKIPISLVHELDEYATWEVHSTDGKSIYKMFQQSKSCPYKCSILCEDCSICVHLYECNCPDAIIRATICKHTHLVVRFLSSTSNPILYKPANIEKLDVLQHIQNADNTDNIDSYRKGLQSLLMSLSGQINVERELKTLQEIKGYITSALNLIKAKNNFKVTSLPPAKQLPPNNVYYHSVLFFQQNGSEKQTSE